MKFALDGACIKTAFTLLHGNSLISVESPLATSRPNATRTPDAYLCMFL